MTEEQWLTCTDPDVMLSHVGLSASERKLRLFAAACCQRILAQQEHGHPGTAPRPQEVEAVALALLPAEPDNMTHRNAAWAAVFAADEIAQGALTATAEMAALPRAFAAERTCQCRLLRDIFGNPFRPVSFAPAWARWNDSTVARLARAIDEECRFSLLPILADALEEAGCDDAAILAHCRAAQDHVRGCWVIDALLGHH